MADDWQEQVLVRADIVLERLRDDIVADAKRYCPVGKIPLSEQTADNYPGKLRDSISGKVEDHKLTIRADTDYAAPVELGYHLIAWGHDTGRDMPAQPYLRPAVYKHRGE
jgi:hypothetical protein